MLCFSMRVNSGEDEEGEGGEADADVVQPDVAWLLTLATEQTEAGDAPTKEAVGPGPNNLANSKSNCFYYWYFALLSSTRFSLTKDQ